MMEQSLGSIENIANKSLTHSESVDRGPRLENYQPSRIGSRTWEWKEGQGIKGIGTKLSAPPPPLALHLE